MGRIDAIDYATVMSLLAAKRVEDTNTFGKLADVANNSTITAALGVRVTNNETAITAAQSSATAANTSITNQAPVTCTSTTRPANPGLGKVIYETDTAAIGRWDGTKWVMEDTREQAYTPVLTSSGATVTLGTGNTRTGKYRRLGEFVHYYGTLYTGTSGFVGGLNTLRISLPFKVKTATITKYGVGIVNARGEDFDATSRVDPAGTWLIFQAAYLDANNMPNRIKLANVANTDGSGTPGTGVPRFAGNYTWDSNNPGYMNWDIVYPADYTVPGP